MRSPARMMASPVYPPTVRVPASTKPATLFEMMFEMKFIFERKVQYGFYKNKDIISSDSTAGSYIYRLQNRSRHSILKIVSPQVPDLDPAYRLYMTSTQVGGNYGHVHAFPLCSSY